MSGWTPTEGTIPHYVLSVFEDHDAVPLRNDDLLREYRRRVNLYGYPDSSDQNILRQRRKLTQAGLLKRHWTGSQEGAWSLEDGTSMGLPWDRLEVGDCWEWTGSLTQAGYGHMSVDGKLDYTHRIVWELLVGPIPEGLVIDHLCRNRACCNPDHLEPVEQAVNVRRGIVADVRRRSAA